MSLTGALVALGEIEKETNLLSGLTGNANESIGGHARRLAAEYSPDGQCHDLIGQALNTILKRDSNASGNHHRSFACSIVVEEMYKSMFKGQAPETARANILSRLKSSSLGSNSSWSPDLMNFYAEAAVSYIPKTGNAVVDTIAQVVNPFIDSTGAGGSASGNVGASGSFAPSVTSQAGMSLTSVGLAAGLLTVALVAVIKR